MKRIIFFLSFYFLVFAPLLAANTAPTISAVPDINLCASNTGVYSFTVGDAETPAGSLIVTFTNPCAGKPYYSTLGGSGANRTLTIQGVGAAYTCDVILSVKDGNGAITTSQFKLSLTIAGPLASFTGLPATTCSENPISILDATFPGGTFSGKGVISGTFNPALAGPGTHIISYNYVDSYCPMTAAKQVVVRQAPNPPIITKTDFNVCEDGKVNIAFDNDYPYTADNRFYTEASGGIKVYDQLSKGYKNYPSDLTIVPQPVSVKPVVPVGQATAYYVSLYAEGTGCESKRVGPINVHTVGKPQIPKLTAGTCVSFKYTNGVISKSLPISASTDNPTDKFYWRGNSPEYPTISNMGYFDTYSIQEKYSGNYFIHTVSADGCSSPEISFSYKDLVVIPTSTVPEYCLGTKATITFDYPNFTSGLTMNVIHYSGVTFNKVASKVSNFVDIVNLQTNQVYKQPISSCKAGALIEVIKAPQKVIKTTVNYLGYTTFCGDRVASTTALKAAANTLNYSYVWYDNANNEIPGVTTNTYNVKIIPDQTTNYYVAYKDVCGIGPKLKLTLSATPAFPIIQGQQICGGATNFVASITNANDLNNYNWNSSILGTSVSNLPTATFPASILLPSSTAKFMTVVARNNETGCSTQVFFNPIQVTPPAIPSSSNVSICGPGNITLTAIKGGLVNSSGITSTYNWYTTATGGTSLGSGATFTRYIPATTDFYVAAANDCWESVSRTKVTATVLSFPTPSFTAPTICTGGSSTITYTGPDETGNSILFNGVNAYGKVARKIKDNFTLEFWMKTTAASSAGTEWWEGEALIDASVTGVNNDFGISLLNNKVAFGIGNPNQTIQSITQVNDGAWHHIAAVRKAGTAIELYVDGVQEAVASSSSFASLDANSTITLAYKQDLNYTRTNVQMDELRIWNLARTSTDIHDYKNTLVPATSAGLVGYYTFDGATASKVIDQSPSANDITVSGGYSFPAASTALVNPMIQWSPASHLSSFAGTPVIATPPASLDYTATVTGKNGCVATSVVSVVVSPLPTAPAVSNRSQCSNDVGPLINTTLAASGAVTGTVYVWYDNTGAVFKTSTDYLDNTISFPSDISRTFTVSIKNSSNCESEKIPVTYTVNQSPANPIIILNPTGPVCGGSSGFVGIQRESGYTDVNYKILSFPSGTKVNSSIATSMIVKGYNVTWGYTQGSFDVLLTDPVTHCEASSSVVISLKPTPIAPIAPDVAICKAGIATLTASGIPAGNYNYNWYDSPEGNSAIGVGPTLNVTLADFSASLYYVSIVDNTLGCEGPRKEVTAYVDNTSSTLPPPVVTYNASGCKGTGGRYDIARQPGYTYSASLPTGTNIVPGSCNGNGAYQWCEYTFGGAGGDFIVTGTNASGCTVSSTQKITVLALPDIIAIDSSSICSGETTNIALSSNLPGSTFSWTALNPVGLITGASDGIGNAIIQTLTGSGTIQYNITASNGNGCTAPVKSIFQKVNLNTVSISVSANPNQVTPTQVANNVQITFTANAINGGTNPVYQWTVDGVVKGTNSPTYKTTNLTYASRAAAGSQVRCTVTSNMACVANTTATSAPVKVSINCPTCREDNFTEIDNSEITFTIYPNPFSEYINVFVPLLENEKVELVMTDLNGKEVEHLVSTNSNTELGRSLSTGIYLLKVITKDGIHTYKISKLK